MELCLIRDEPSREKTNNLSLRPGQTQTGLYIQRSKLEALNFGFKYKRDCTIHVEKTNTLISFAVMICSFVFTQAFCWFSYAADQIQYLMAITERKCFENFKYGIINGFHGIALKDMDRKFYIPAFLVATPSVPHRKVMDSKQPFSYLVNFIRNQSKLCNIGRIFCLIKTKYMSVFP